MPRYLAQAPRGMFRVILTEGDDELLIGDFDSFREACMAAARKADSPQTHLRIYDESGLRVGELGASF